MGRDVVGGSTEAECSLVRKLKVCFERMPWWSQLVVEVPDKNHGHPLREIGQAQIVKTAGCQALEFHPSTKSRELF